MSPRPAAVFLLLLAVYVATLSIPAAAGERYAGDEVHHLLGAISWREDGDIDLTDQYAMRAWAPFTDVAPRPSGEPTNGRLHEPQGLGLPLAISLPYAIGGTRGAELLIAVLTALAFAVSVLLARRLVPEPWASAGVVTIGLSPPALAAATTIAPEPVAGAMLTGAAWCALKVRESARLRYAYGGALLLALLPWLDVPMAVAGVPAGVALVRWTLGERRRLTALIAAELMLGSVVFFARLSETFYGGPAPAFARVGGAGPGDAGGWLERAWNLVTLWLHPAAGLLRWAPALLLAFYGAWLLWRSRRELVATVIPERRESERAAELLLAVTAAVWVAAAFAVDDVDGPWFAGLPMAAALPLAAPLAAWGLRPARRVGAALCALTLALSVWALADAWLGSAEGWLTVVP